MKTKLYLKHLLSLAIVIFISTSINAQKHGYHGFRGVVSSVSPNPSAVGDTLTLKIFATAADTFSIAIFNGADTIHLDVTGGKTVLPLLNAGQYGYSIFNTSGQKVSGGIIFVKEPRVRTQIFPNPSTVGDTVSIKVEAPSTESFTLSISDTGGTVLNTLTVTGGKTTLPLLPVGFYSYSLVNADGKTVAKGSIIVKAPKVFTKVTANPSVVGDTTSLLLFAPETETFTLKIADTAGIIITTLDVHGGTNVLPLFSVGVYSYTLENTAGYIVSSGKIVVKAPKIKSFVHPALSHAGDTLSINIIADVTESFTLNIYTYGDSLVQTLIVNGGKTQLPSLSSGFYYYELSNSEGYKVSKGKITILPPKVHTVIAPNPSNAGEATIAVDADLTETFTLNIYDAANLVYSQTINGGITSLPPTLDSGIHFYTVVNTNGEIVSKGRIMIF